MNVPYEGLMAETISYSGHNGDEIAAYFARPLGLESCPGVVVIHHMPGWDEGCKEITRKLAHHGYAAIDPNLHHRWGPGEPDDVSARVRATGGMPDAQTMGDVQGAIKHLRSLPYLNGKVGVIGFCSGGRQTYLAACTLKNIDAAVDCWGGRVVMKKEDATPQQPVAPIDLTSGITCPLLGLFGAEDKAPLPAEVAQIEAELKRFGKTYEFHMYDNAGHGFFATDRPNYRQHAAVEGWNEVFKWFEKYLKVPAAAAVAV
jgi:carboxymethylenebutenolidase